MWNIIIHTPSMITIIVGSLVGELFLLYKYRLRVSYNEPIYTIGAREVYGSV